MLVFGGVPLVGIYGDMLVPHECIFFFWLGDVFFEKENWTLNSIIHFFGGVCVCVVFLFRKKWKLNHLNPNIRQSNHMNIYPLEN